MQYRDPVSGSRLVCHSDYSRKNTIIERWWPWVLVVEGVGLIRPLLYGLCGGRWCSIGIQSEDLVWSVIPIIQERIRLSSDGWVLVVEGVGPIRPLFHDLRGGQWCVDRDPGWQDRQRFQSALVDRNKKSR